MENKTTTELIDLLTKLVDKEGNLQEGWEEASEELLTRDPFNLILSNKFSEGDSLEERLDGLEEDIKLLKRHKHDDKSNDVLIRI